MGLSEELRGRTKQYASANFRFQRFSILAFAVWALRVEQGAERLAGSADH
jgi:hypothetical protein